MDVAVEQLHGRDGNSVMYARIAYVRLLMLPKHSVNGLPAIARGFIFRLFQSVLHAFAAAPRGAQAIEAANP
jgi:hypothetical protein